MASVTSGAVVLFDGCDLSPYLKKVQVTGGADMLDCTSLADTGTRKYTKGLIDFDISGEGFFQSNPANAQSIDDVNGAFENALVDTSGDHLIAVGPDGYAVGSPAAFGEIRTAKYDVNGDIGQLIMTQFAAKGSTTSTAKNIKLGVWLAYGTYTTATNGSTYDNSAGVTGYVVQVNEVDGDNDVAVQLQHSTNGSVWVDLGSSIPCALGDPGTVVLDTSTSVNRYVRANVTPAGTTCTVGVVIKLGYTG